jgi:ankyrin repeat protein
MRSSIISAWFVLFLTTACMSKVNGDTELMDTLITMAVIKNNVNLVKHLLDNGADAKIIDSSGNTALMYAVENGNKKMVELLLPASDAKTSNKYGTTPLMYARVANVVAHHDKLLTQ